MRHLARRSSPRDACGPAAALPHRASGTARWSATPCCQARASAPVGWEWVASPGRVRGATSRHGTPAVITCKGEGAIRSGEGYGQVAARYNVTNTITNETADTPADSCRSGAYWAVALPICSVLSSNSGANCDEGQQRLRQLNGQLQRGRERGAPWIETPPRGCRQGRYPIRFPRARGGVSIQDLRALAAAGPNAAAYRASQG